MESTRTTTSANTAEGEKPQPLMIDPTTLPVHFKMRRRNRLITCSDRLGAAKTSFPVPTDCACFYFEVEVERPSCSETQYLCIGGGSARFPNSAYPGFLTNSFGFSSVSMSSFK
jgi:hypothetical protein